MSTPKAKTPAELFDDFIKLEWQDIFRKEVDVRLDNGARYVPNSGARGVQLLRKDVNAFEEAIRIWSGVRASGSPYVTVQVIPGMPHAIARSPAGLAALRSALGNP